MRHLSVAVALALVASLVFVPAAFSQTKWVRGTVVSVAGDTLVVKAEGKDWTFKVDKSTVVTARGAGKAQAAAERKGQEGIKFADFVKPGMGVEVHYKDVGGALMAIDVHSGLAPTEQTPATQPASGSARGTLSAVANASVTLKTAEKEWVFAVDPNTLVVGQGMGTITAKFKEEGKKPTVSDLLKVNDEVVVYFKDAANAKLATEIRVLRRVMK
jgi:hypothetical protein